MPAVPGVLDVPDVPGVPGVLDVPDVPGAPIGTSPWAKCKHSCQITQGILARILINLVYGCVLTRCMAANSQE